MGSYLRVTVFYTDQHGSGNQAQAVSVNAVRVAATNRDPAFTEGASTTRSVSENTAAGQNVGQPVTARDPNGDRLTYSLGGTDSAAFDIVASSGQLQTKAALNYEAKNSYAVTVSVRDGKDPDRNSDTRTDDTIRVTITVADVNETPARTARRSGGGGGGGGGGAFLPATLPLAGISPRNLVFTAILGGENPPGRLLQLWSPAARYMTFDVSGNVPWVSVTPASGASTGPLDRVLVTVAVDATGLPAGRHRAQLQISGAGFRGSPQRVGVVVTVTSGAFAGTLAPQYDANNNLMIEFDEVLAAVKDYFDDRITLEAVLEIVKVYFAG